MSEHDPASDYECFGPWGRMGEDVGDTALMLVESLLEVPSPDTPPYTWDIVDDDAYNLFTEVDTGLRFIEPREDVEGNEIGDLHRLFERLHMAFPFSEAERHWLRTGGDEGADLGSALCGRVEEIMENGVIRVLQGRDLARRWWAWRRERDEFAHQGSLAEGRNVLVEIANTLVTEEHWPVRYRELRRPS